MGGVGREVLENYTLHGDPAVHIRLPKSQIEMAAHTNIMDTTNLIVSLKLPDESYNSLHLSVVDLTQETTLFSKIYPLKGKETSLKIPVLEKTSPGHSLRVSAYAWSDNPPKETMSGLTYSVQSSNISTTITSKI